MKNNTEELKKEYAELDAKYQAMVADDTLYDCEKAEAIIARKIEIMRELIAR